MQVLGDITKTNFRRITWASFGSDSDSWFFAYEHMDGTHSFRHGPAIPLELYQYIQKLKPTPYLRSALRVQLGQKNSFVAWSGTLWVCYDIPAALKAGLCQMSGAYMRSTNITRGSFKFGLLYAVWHSDGSYFGKSQHGYHWNFESAVTRQAWLEFWSRNPTLSELSELVVSPGYPLAYKADTMKYVALDAHAPVGETFAFIKKQHDAQEAPFVLRFFQDTTHTADTLKSTAAAPDTHLQHVERKPDEPKYFQWAISKRNGRPHPKESWELELKKGQKVKVWEDRGRNWFIVEGGKGVKGWAHGTWLEFCGSKVYKDPQSTYAQFQDDMRKLLVPGQLQDFPALREYMSICAEAACEPLKSDTLLGICVHDLQTLLEGSGQYSYEWLKEERNVWHPDRFARYCRPERKEQLKASAQEVFVLYGVLMDECSQQKE